MEGKESTHGQAQMVDHESSAESVIEEDMLVSHPSNYRTVALFDSPQFDPSNVRREELSIPGTRCFVLHNLLSEQECQHYIAASEKAGYSDLKGQFKEEYRNNDRVLVLSESLASVLWERIEPCLTRRDILRIRPMCFGNEGTWKPIRLNECFKFGKYFPGCRFSPHIDGPWVPREDESSIYTVVIYLNSDFQGGGTNFLFEEGEKKGEIACKVKPETGMALIFNHDVLHEGETVNDGVKYIARTEILFRRVDTENLVDPQSYATKENYLRTVKLYRKSMKLERQGDVQGFTDTYLEALRLQRAEQASVAKDADDLFNQPLPLETYLYIFSFLSDRELVPLLTVCKDWYDMVTDGSLWKHKYVGRWPTGNINTITPCTYSVSPTGPLAVAGFTQDWYGFYWHRAKIGKGRSTVVFDCGSHSMKSARIDEETMEVLVGDVESIVAKVPGLFDLHLRRDCFERFFCGKQARTVFDKNLFRVIKSGSIVDPSTLPELLAAMYAALVAEPRGHMVLVAEPVKGWDEEQKGFIKDALFKLFRIPMLAFESAAVLSLYNLKISSGIVISVGHNVASVAAVWKGHLLKDHVWFQEFEKLPPPKMHWNIIRTSYPYDHELSLDNEARWEKQVMQMDFGKHVHDVMVAAAASKGGDTEMIKIWAQHIVLSGGKTLIAGFETKLNEDLQKHLPGIFEESSSSSGEQRPLFRVMAPDDRIHDVVQGGCHLTALMNSKKDILEHNEESVIKKTAEGRHSWGDQTFKPAYSKGFYDHAMNYWKWFGSVQQYAVQNELRKNEGKEELCLEYSCYVPDSRPYFERLWREEAAKEKNEET